MKSFFACVWSLQRSSDFWSSYEYNYCAICTCRTFGRLEYERKHVYKLSVTLKKIVKALICFKTMRSDSHVLVKQFCVWKSFKRCRFGMLARFLEEKHLNKLQIGYNLAPISSQTNYTICLSFRRMAVYGCSYHVALCRHSLLTVQYYSYCKHSFYEKGFKHDWKSHSFFD